MVCEPKENPRTDALLPSQLANRGVQGLYGRTRLRDQSRQLEILPRRWHGFHRRESTSHHQRDSRIGRDANARTRGGRLRFRMGIDWKGHRSIKNTREIEGSLPSGWSLIGKLHVN